MSRKEGILYKGKFCPVWGGLYCANSEGAFARGGLDGLSRAIKAEMHDAAVVVEYDTEDEERSDI